MFIFNYKILKLQVSIFSLNYVKMIQNLRRSSSVKTSLSEGAKRRKIGVLREQRIVVNFCRHFVSLREGEIFSFLATSFPGSSLYLEKSTLVTAAHVSARLDMIEGRGWKVEVEVEVC